MIKKAYRYILKKNRKLRNKNYNFTILCDSCIAGVIYSELGIQFNTPTINLYIRANEYIKFVSNLNFYLNQELKEIKKTGIDFPIGLLNDIEVYFKHYHSFNDAKKKWDERKKRINTDNLFLIMTENELCSYDVLEQFDKLPYTQKIVFTHMSYPKIKSSFYIKGFESNKELGNIIDYSNRLGKRYYDQFDWIKWLNKEIEA